LQLAALVKIPQDKKKFLPPRRNAHAKYSKYGNILSRTD